MFQKARASLNPAMTVGSWAGMRIANIDAARAWNGFDGEHWTEYEERYNASLRPHAARLSSVAAIAATDDVLDVGCGCGESTREAARSARSVLGVDLAWPSARTLLLNDAPMSMLTVSIPAARSDPSWSKNASRVAVSFPSAPHTIFLGSPGTDVGHPGDLSWGRSSSMGPQESMTRASAALAEWKP